MELDNFLGNQNVVHSLKTSLANGRLAHSVLLAAPNGCGCGFAARLLAADYIAPNGGELAKAVLRMQCPEFIIVQGEGKSLQITVARIREVRKEIFKSSLSSNGRVVWVKDAQNMAAPAANALLKVLEEPPKGALFILTANDATSLAPTIVSRCMLYPLAPLSPKECELRLQKHLTDDHPQSLTKLLSILYGGRLGLCINALASENRLGIINDALSCAQNAAKANTYALFCLFAKYEGRTDEDKQNRTDLLSDMCNALASCLQHPPVPGSDNISPKTAAFLLPHLQEARILLKANGAPKIVLTALSLKLTGLA